MPYLTKEDRGRFDKLLVVLKETVISSPGELNYLVAELINQVLEGRSINYTLLNGIIGALECNKMEMYRKLLAGYEDKKEQENGKVWRTI